MNIVVCQIEIVRFENRVRNAYKLADVISRIIGFYFSTAVSASFRAYPLKIKGFLQISAWARVEPLAQTL